VSRVIPFVPAALHGSDDPALLDDVGGPIWSWRRLVEESNRWITVNSGLLIFLYCRNRPSDVAALLGLVAGGNSVALLDGALPQEARDRLKAQYSPDLIVEDAVASVFDLRAIPSGGRIHPDNAVLLSTSGSTGSPKFVRLSLSQLESNAAGIAETLDIDVGEVGSGHLPFHYSYGLSVLTSHLCRGAPLLLSERGFMDGAFWKALAAQKVRHLPGVPYHYQMMQRLNVARLPLSGVRVMTQAGGALPVDVREQFWSFMEAKGGRFHVMYGQTEAAPRMTTLAHEDFPAAPTSVGRALPGGRIDILGPDGAPVAVGQSGVVVYAGPNVMLGYAQSRTDLALGDMMQSTLETGDLGFLDASNRLTLVGRANRIVKVVGLRINLDDIEAGLSRVGIDVAVTASGDRLRVHHAAPPNFGEEGAAILREHVLSFTSLPVGVLEFVRHDSLPRTTRGKIDRSALDPS